MIFTQPLEKHLSCILNGQEWIWFFHISSYIQCRNQRSSLVNRRSYCSLQHLEERRFSHREQHLMEKGRSLSLVHYLHVHIFLQHTTNQACQFNTEMQSTTDELNQVLTLHFCFFDNLLQEKRSATFNKAIHHGSIFIWSANIDNIEVIHYLSSLSCSLNKCFNLVSAILQTCIKDKCMQHRLITSFFLHCLQFSCRTF